ncbi:MAG: hypothetical protein ACREMF_00045, partial [Gemmatimonadales bacterium]
NGATLSGTTTVNAVAGVASFSTLSIDKAGTGYRLSASSPGTAGINSSTFQILAGPVTHLNFSTQPTSTPAGASITPAVEVSARDAFENVVRTFTGDITVALGTNPTGGTLSGTLTVAAVQGVATFVDLSINTAGSGYRLSASATGLPTAGSSAFSITP